MIKNDNKLQTFLEEFPLNKLTLPASPAKYLKVDFLEPKLDNNDSSSSSSLQSLYQNHAQISSPLPFASSVAYQMKLVDAKYLISSYEFDEDVKSVIELTLDAQEIWNSFAPGDTIGILPENDDKDIELILNALNLTNAEADNQIQISLRDQTNTKKSNRIPSHIPLSSTTIRIILKQCLHINSIPKKLFLRSLIDCTTDEQEKQFLKLMCSKEGTEFYTKMINENGLTFIKLLQLCPSCKPDLSLLIEHLPRLLPRPYSIATSPLEENQNRIKIIASILKENPGVATNYLRKFVDEFVQEEKTLGTMNPIYVSCYLRQQNQFKYRDTEIMENVILISIGCGISPFLGFLKHKEMYFERNRIEKLSNDSEIWLLTGYKYRKCSLYQNEIRTYLKTGIINRLYESYSRELDSKFKYVQDHIWENRNDFSKMLFDKDSILYVCADGKNISKNIQETILKVIKTALECNDEEAKMEFVKLQKNDRYREDIWM